MVPSAPEPAGNGDPDQNPPSAVFTSGGVMFLIGGVVVYFLSGQRDALVVSGIGAVALVVAARQRAKERQPPKH